MTTPTGTHARCKRPLENPKITRSVKRTKLTPCLTTLPPKVLDSIFSHTLDSTPSLKLVCKKIYNASPSLPTTFVGRFRWLFLSPSVNSNDDRLYTESLSGIRPAQIRNESKLTSTFSTKCWELYQHEVKLENLSRTVGNSEIRIVAEIAGDGNMELLPILVRAIPPLQRQEALNEGLWLAALKGQVQACRLLLEKGADPLWKNGQGDTPLSAASDRLHTGVLMDLLRATRGERRQWLDWQPKIDQALWAALSKQPKYQNDTSGEELTCKILLMAGANPLSKKPNGSILMGSVAVMQKLDILKILHSLVKQEQKKGPVWQKIVDRSLYLATRRKDVDFAKILLGEGADPKWKSYDLRSARDLAQGSDNKQLVDLLRSPIAVR